MRAGQHVVSSGSGCKSQELLDVQHAEIETAVYEFEFKPDVPVRAFDLPEMTLSALGTRRNQRTVHGSE